MTSYPVSELFFKHYTVLGSLSAAVLIGRLYSAMNCENDGTKMPKRRKTLKVSKLN